MGWSSKLGETHPKKKHPKLVSFPEKQNIYFRPYRGNKRFSHPFGLTKSTENIHPTPIRNGPLLMRSESRSEVSTTTSCRSCGSGNLRCLRFEISIWFISKYYLEYIFTMTMTTKILCILQKKHGWALKSWEKNHINFAKHDWNILKPLRYSLKQL